ncbi:helix-turn-helix domain-containing protein [Enterococcus sp. AZ196]|uniref:helix-turn-helix domain-containing protein n=1 Tax=Enterococcus sp. AZ196 TaxID=2774659 RepID=UPI003D28BA04
MTIFERIQFLAKKRDKTLKDVSLELGYSKNYLYTLQKQTPNADKLSALAEYFHVSADYLLGRTDNPAINDSEILKEFDITDGSVIMNYEGKALSESEKQVILAAARALVEQREKNVEE